MAGAAAPATTSPPASAAGGQSLDDLMLAMDVVDTLRHDERLVLRELDEGSRDAQLIERLRQIYRGQGIDVPDRVLQEGVDALKESRFAYTPPPPSLGRTLAAAWVNRARFGVALLGLAALITAGAGLYYAGVVRPEQQRQEQAQASAERERTALAERLPRALEQGHREVVAEARDPLGRERADQLLADGRAAVERRDVPGAEEAITGLEELRADLRREYVLRVVSRPNEPSGVWRIPGRNRNARNYYLVVEAVAPDGRVLPMSITNEEDGRTETVQRWGVRVSQAVFDEMRRDKGDDGIVQNSRLGEKRRGFFEIAYNRPVLGGTITRW